MFDKDIGVGHFNVLWTGQIEAPVTGDYLFESESDDGAEVWVNGVQIVANWGQREGNSIAQGTVSLVAGQKYDFKVYYLNVDGPAVMKLRWRKPGDSVTTIIPAERLYHPVIALPQVKLEFAYDGQGRRVSKKVSNWDGGAWTLAGSTLFLYDGWNLIAELNAMNANTAVRTYTWGLDLSGSLQGAGGVGGLLFSSTQTPNPGTYASAFDGNGNVIAYVDLAIGAKSATYEYNAFGETIIADGVDLPFRFSTKYTDSESALLYYGRRYYNSDMGRWVTRDPAEESGGTNLYAAIRNCLLSEVDPFGLAELNKPDSVLSVRILTEKEKAQFADTEPREITRPGPGPFGAEGYYYRRYVTKRTCFYRIFCKCCATGDKGLDLEPRFFISSQKNVDAPKCSSFEGLQWAWSRAGSICNLKAEFK